MKLQMYLLIFSGLSLQAMQRPTDQEFMTMIEMNFSWRGTLQSHEEIFALVQNNPELAHARNSHGSTPLHFAVAGNNRPLMSALITAGADLDAQNNNGDRPIWGAARWQLPGNPPDYQGHLHDHYLPILTILLDARADTTVLDHGDSLLDRAIKIKNLSMFTALLCAGADYTLPNVDGRMPLHYAIGSFKERVEQVIADYEASLYLLK